MGTEAPLLGLELLPVSQRVEPSQRSRLHPLPAKPVSRLLPRAGRARNRADRSSCSTGSSAAPHRLPCHARKPLSPLVSQCLASPKPAPTSLGIAPAHSPQPLPSLPSYPDTHAVCFSQLARSLGQGMSLPPGFTNQPLGARGFEL